MFRSSKESAKPSETQVKRDGKTIYQVDSKNYTRFLDQVSSFRSALSYFNVGLANLTLYYQTISPKDCQRMATINNRCIRSFFFSHSDQLLVHDSRLKKIISYPQLEIDGIKAKNLLEKFEIDINQELQRIPKVIYKCKDDDDAVYTEEMKPIISPTQVVLCFDQKQQRDEFQTELSKRINDEKRFYDARDNSEFLSSKIAPIFSKDEDENSAPPRYYGHKYEAIPKHIEFYLLKYLALINIRNSIKIIRGCIEEAERLQLQLNDAHNKARNLLLEKDDLSFEDINNLEVMKTDLQNEFIEKNIEKIILDNRISSSKMPNNSKDPSQPMHEIQPNIPQNESATNADSKNEAVENSFISKYENQRNGLIDAYNQIAQRKGEIEKAKQLQNLSNPATVQQNKSGNEPNTVQQKASGPKRSDKSIHLNEIRRKAEIFESLKVDREKRIARNQLLNNISEENKKLKSKNQELENQIAEYNKKIEELNNQISIFQNSMERTESTSENGNQVQDQRVVTSTPGQSSEQVQPLPIKQNSNSQSSKSQKVVGDKESTVIEPALEIFGRKPNS